MTVQISWLKGIAIVALVTGIFAPLYTSSTATILGLPASVFLTAVTNTFAGMGLLLARQNNQTSEDVKAPNALGTGNGTPPKTGV